MIVQASVLASTVRQTPVKTPLPTGTESDTASSSNEETTSTEDSSPVVPSSFAALIAQLPHLGTISVPTTGFKTTAKTNSNSSGNSSNSTSTPSTGKDASPAPATPTVLNLSMLMAQASIQASTTKSPVTATTISTTTPGLAKAVVGAAKEKKSASEDTEGSFLQAHTEASDTTSSLLSSLGLSTTSTVYSGVQQPLTSSVGAKNSSLNGVSTTTTTLAGTANVEKGSAMNAELNVPEIFSGYGANVATQPSAADLHIQLSQNSDFEDAIKQVMHIAELTQTNESRAPMRVEMEIQTPPGAIVNVYVSRQNDQWRAQLSTNDPQALAWVQDKMSSLRQSNDFGVEVRWLPPQMESTSISSTSSDTNSNLGWDRGGQEQSNYQQPDERSQSERQKRAGVTPDYATVPEDDFMSALTAVGAA
jgi:hypothetical protein